MEAQHILGLEAENFKRLKAVSLTFDQKHGLIVLKGKNKQGKSSVIEAIIAAIAGKKYAIDKPVKEGEKSAKVVVKTEDLIITHRWTKAGGDALEVTSGDGMVYKSPQTLLNKLIEVIGFDPMEFAEMEPKEQTEELLRICPVELDLAENAKSIKEAEVARRDRNRDVKRLQGALSEYPEGECPEKIDLSKVSAELESLNKAKEARAEASAALAGMMRAGREMEDAKRELEAEIKNMQAELEGMTAKIKQTKEEFEGKKAEYEKLPDPGEEIAKLHEKMKQAQETNAVVSQFEQKKRVEGELKSAEDNAKLADDEVEKLRKQRAEAVGKAKFPVKGLAISEDGTLLYDGNPLKQCSSAEQIQIGVGLAAATNPKLKIAFVRHGSLLDDDSMKTLAELAKEKELLVIVERVKDDSPAAIHIVDGAVAEEKPKEEERK